MRSETEGAGFSHGERVALVTGPFKLIEGVFDRRMSSAGRVRILLNLVEASASVAVQTEARNLKRLPV